MAQYMISTKDNPYNPFSQMDEWSAFDDEKGYGTLAYLARLIHIPDEATENEKNEAINEAVSTMVANDLQGIYTIISDK